LLLPSFLQVAMPVMGRSLHAAVAVDRDLYILHGDSAGDMLREYAMVDTSDGTVANWLEPILKVLHDLGERFTFL
jgi:hypothetical protein